MITLSITFLIAFIAFYYAFQGKPVIIEANKYKLNGRLYGDGKAGIHRHGSAILFLSGWNPTTHRVTTSNFYAGFSARKRNNICLTVSLRGMGSEGDINVLTRTDFMDDVIAAYDFLANTDGVNKEDIRVVGESFGGYLACILSTLRPVKKMALRVPTDFSNEGFADIPQIIIAGNLSNDWKNQRHSFTESYALKAINEYNGRLMMVASEKDDFVPIQTTKNYLAAVNDPSKLEYLFMKKASHSMFHPKLQWDYTRKLLDWLRLQPIVKFFGFRYEVFAGKTSLSKEKLPGYFKFKQIYKQFDYNNNTIISIVTDSADWKKLKKPGFCRYNNESTSNKNGLSALYNWYAADTSILTPTLPS